MMNRQDPYHSKLGTSDQRWVELYRHASFEQAMTVLTSVAAMEFDVRLIDENGRRAVGPPDPLHGENRPGNRAADRLEPVRLAASRIPDYIVQVRCADWPDLNDVLASLIEEQREFDERVCQRERVRTTIFVTGVVATSAVAGYTLYRTVRAVIE